MEPSLTPNEPRPSAKPESDSSFDLPLATDSDLIAGPPIYTPQHHGIFMGRFGLRAGWGMLIFIIVFVLLSILAGTLAMMATGHLQQIIAAREAARLHPNAPRPHLQFDFVPLMVWAQDGITFAGLFCLCFLFSRGERRPLRAYGLGHRRLSDFLPGAFWGIAMMCALIFVLHFGGWLVFDGRVLHGAPIFLYGLKWLLAFLLVGLSEEYSFRGYLQYTLMRGVWGLAEKFSPTNPRPFAFWIAATLLSLLFGLVHLSNGGENAFGLIQVVFAGLTFAYALWRTGSLWWGIGFHMTWDWAQSFLFGVPDSGNLSVGRLFTTHAVGRPLLSGGSDGPEGSLFATAALALTIAIIHFTTRPGLQPAIDPEPTPAPPFHSAPA